MIKRISTLDRYWAKVDASAGPGACWLWTGAPDKDGYGIFWDGTYSPNGRGHYVRVNRWTFEQFVGPLAAGQQVCHSCDNPPCVNPSHLWAGTCKENLLDRDIKGRSVTAILTPESVRLIRGDFAKGGISKAALGRRYGVHANTIRAVLFGQTWRHVA